MAKLFNFSVVGKNIDVDDDDDDDDNDDADDDNCKKRSRRRGRGEVRGSVIDEKPGLVFGLLMTSW